jgi:hypothetical protein
MPCDAPEVHAQQSIQVPPMTEVQMFFASAAG